MDRRIFRMVWEHKKSMLERINLIEKFLGLGNELSMAYEPIVKNADTMRMLYASHHMRRRDSVLPIIQNMLIQLMQEERLLLEKLLNVMEAKLQDDSVGICEKQNASKSAAGNM